MTEREREGGEKQGIELVDQRESDERLEISRVGETG